MLFFHSKHIVGINLATSSVKIIMEQIIPLIQTLLWVGLIGSIIWRFNQPIYELLVALRKRIETGSDLKVGPFEITQQLTSQDITTQKTKANTELVELSRTATSTLAKPSNLQARYYQAEDLALRAIQADYGIPISRQVTGGTDTGFDGAFSINGQLHIVEVKYTYHKISVQTIRDIINGIITSLEHYQWHNVRIILALILEDHENLIVSEQLLKEIAESYQFKIDIRNYVFSELQEQFGMLENTS